MKPEKQRANAWSQLVIGAAIEVHRIKGPGLIESIYSKCFQREMLSAIDSSQARTSGVDRIQRLHF
jgi:PD-(D/E)XK nuclease superfamily